MAIYVISDLHLDEASGARMFRDERQGRHLAELTDAIAKDSNAELILLGDTFDFTSMTQPRSGLLDFARKLDFPIEPVPPRSLTALCQAIARSNPEAIGALAALSSRVPVTFVPGNHDHRLGEPLAASALKAIGISPARIEPSVVVRADGRTAVLQHGHAWDPGNAKPGGPGEVLTQALHQAVIPFLRHTQTRRNIRVDPDRIVALRPEEAVIPVLERWLPPERFRAFFHALLELISENGIATRPLTWLAPLITPERVRRRIQKQDGLWERAARSAVLAMAGRRALPANAPRPDLLVLGHTHVIDWAVEEGGPARERLYVNLGTWTERVSDASGPPDTTLPFLKLDPHLRKADLIDASTSEPMQTYAI